MKSAFRAALNPLHFIAVVYSNTNTVLLDFHVLLTVNPSIILDNDQLDTRLLYFTIRLL